MAGKWSVVIAGVQLPLIAYSWIHYTGLEEAWIGLKGDVPYAAL